MKLFVRLFLISLLLPLCVSAQSSGFRAQGRYYSAKEAFEAGRPAEAAQLLRESREFLGGKSNIRLQYLLVRSLYSAGKFKEAQQEMGVFFAITDAKGEERTKIYQNYPQDVDQLTNDETREISIMIDKIDREVAAGTEQKNAVAAQAAAKEAQRREAFEALRAVILKRYICEYSRLPGPDGVSDTWADIAVTGSYGSMTVSFKSQKDSNTRGRGRPYQKNSHQITFDLGKVTTYTATPGTSLVGGSVWYRGPVDRPAYTARLNFPSQLVTSRQTEQAFDSETGRQVSNDSHSFTWGFVGFPVSSPQAFEAAMKQVKAAQ
jgi:hypothetical protein